MRAARLALLALLVVAGRAPAQRTEDEQRIRELIATHQRASERADLRALVDLYAPDAQLVSSNGQRVIGREAIEAYYRSVIESPLGQTGRHLIHPPETINIRFVGSDFALVDVGSVSVGGRDMTGRLLPDAPSLLATAWRKLPAGWVMVEQRTLSSAPIAGSQEAVRIAALAAEQARFTAMMQNDFVALDSLLADDLLYTHSTGIVENKKAFLESLTSHRIVYKSITPNDIRVTALGPDGALITGRSRMSLGGNEPKELDIRYMDVLVRRAGRWQTIAWESKRLQD